MENNQNTSQPDFEIGDVEGYGSQRDTAFSHQTLVMLSMRKVLENGAREMRSGWFEEKYDKNGNLSRTYIEDTRLVFISCVECCLMVMQCDLDEEAKSELKALFNKRDDIKKGLNDLEDKEWESLNQIIKLKLTQSGKGNIKGYFSKEKRFYQIYLEECVKIYREIFKSLTNLTKRLDFYVAEIFEA
jgi:hypothetical protein